jgi:hypothetical protein
MPHPSRRFAARGGVLVATLVHVSLTVPLCLDISNSRKHGRDVLPWSVQENHNVVVAAQLLQWLPKAERGTEASAGMLFVSPGNAPSPGGDASDMPEITDSAVTVFGSRRL